MICKHCSWDIKYWGHYRVTICLTCGEVINIKEPESKVDNLPDYDVLTAAVKVCEGIVSNCRAYSDDFVGKAVKTKQVIEEFKKGF